nr:SPOR domain-containing protein [Aliidiomarina quisquiliarum]
MPRLILTATAVIVFVVVLVLLKKQGNSAPVHQQVKQPHTEEALPAPPQEQWSYIEELENKEVEVVVPERAASRPRLIQCASFRNESDADEMRAKIAFMGLEAQVRATQGQTGMWYRVILGPFENQRVAQATTHKLQRGGINNCQIWNWTD